MNQNTELTKKPADPNQVHLMQTSATILCGLLQSSTFSPDITDNDVEENKDGYLIKTKQGTYVNKPRAKKPNNKMITAAQKYYIVKDPMSLYVNDAVRMGKLLVNKVIESET